MLFAISFNTLKINDKRVQEVKNRHLKQPIFFFHDFLFLNKQRKETQGKQQGVLVAVLIHSIANIDGNIFIPGVLQQ